MRWNPYIDLRVEISNAVRAKCKACDVEIQKGTYRAEAIPIIGKRALFHVDCGIKRAPDHAARRLVDSKLPDKPVDWPAEGLAVAERYVPEGTPPAPRSYLRTPITGISYPQTDPRTQDCVFCGLPTPGEPGPGTGHAIKAFSLDGERRFHPQCIVRLAPGLCARVVQENSDRWPAEVKGFFRAVLPDTIEPTPRSPWADTGGVPQLQMAPSGRAACRYCDVKIKKGELRLAREKMYGMRRSPAYFHVECYCKSDDYHPKMLEVVVLKADPEIPRHLIEAWGEVLPPDPPEDDDVPPLLERLLALFDSVPREEAEQEDRNSNLTENVVEFPKGFFSSE